MRLNLQHYMDVIRPVGEPQLQLVPQKPMQPTLLKPTRLQLVMVLRRLPMGQWLWALAAQLMQSVLKPLVSERLPWVRFRWRVDSERLRLVRVQQLVMNRQLPWVLFLMRQVKVLLHWVIRLSPALKAQWQLVLLQLQIPRIRLR